MDVIDAKKKIKTLKKEICSVFECFICRENTTELQIWKYCGCMICHSCVVNTLLGTKYSLEEVYGGIPQIQDMNIVQSVIPLQIPCPKCNEPETSTNIFEIFFYAPIPVKFPHLPAMTQDFKPTECMFCQVPLQKLGGPRKQMNHLFMECKSAVLPCPWADDCQMKINTVDRKQCLSLSDFIFDIFNNHLVDCLQEIQCKGCKEMVRLKVHWDEHKKKNCYGQKLDRNISQGLYRFRNTNKQSMMSSQLEQALEYASALLEKEYPSIK